MIAATHVRRLAEHRGLPAKATFGVTEPEPGARAPGGQELLAEGIDVQGRRPRLVTADDVASASRIVTLGCDLAALGPKLAGERWDDVPAVKDGHEAAREHIDARVARLVDELARAR